MPVSQEESAPISKCSICSRYEYRFWGAPAVRSVPYSTTCRRSRIRVFEMQQALSADHQAVASQGGPARRPAFTLRTAKRLCTYNGSSLASTAFQGVSRVDVSRESWIMAAKIGSVSRSANSWRVRLCTGVKSATK